jgi:hypothetical protein
VIALGGVAYVNNVYNSSFSASSVVDVKPLLFAGIAGLLLDAAAQIPGMGPAMTLLGWTAFAGFLLAPVENPSPVSNLLKITGKG